MVTRGLVGTALLSAFPSAVHTQLVGAGTDRLATAGAASALVRGVEAIGVNPSALALPGGPAWSVTVLPGYAEQGFSPIGWREVTRWEGEHVPRQEREAWVQRLEEEGPLVGSVEGRISGLALQVGGFGFQVGTRGQGHARLNPGAAELLLFGNAGRAGEPADLDLEDSYLDLELLTTAGVAWGRVLHRGSSGQGHPSVLTAGASMHYTFGHALVMSRDGGSAVRADPPEVEIRFPTMEAYSGTPGRGVGASLAVTWLREPFTLSLVAHDLIQTFRWREEAFRYRPGEALLRGGAFETVIDVRPADEAPEALREELAQRGIPTRIRVGAGWEVTERLALSTEVGRGSLSAPPGESPMRAAAGLRYRSSAPGAPVFRAGLGLHQGSLELAGGVGIRAGPLAASTALVGRPKDARIGAALALTLSGTF